MATISFEFDASALVRVRPLGLKTYNKKPYLIPNDPVYQPVHAFLQKYRKYYGGQYPFQMLTMLHVAAVKMFGDKLAKKRYDVSLLATGGLYLALDQKHRSLSIHRSFGDFTAGFSHQFGVALAVMSMSEAYRIPWDKLCSIPVKGKRTLDYEVELPNNSGWLHLEAKGITSKNRYSARRSAFGKKLVDPNNIKSAKQNPHQKPTAMIGVITQAVKGLSENGTIEIIDPDFETESEARQQDNQVAGRYIHYAGVAQFAGLNSVARELRRRADMLVEGGYRDYFGPRHFESGQHLFQVQNRLIAGVQWRPGDSLGPQNDVWFYQGVDVQNIRMLVEGEFPETVSYETHVDYDPRNRTFYTPTIERDDRIESFLPDGSYFGIGIGPRDGLLIVDKSEDDWNDRQIGRLH